MAFPAQRSLVHVICVTSFLVMDVYLESSKTLSAAFL